MPRLLLQARREKQVELFTSTALLAELADILGRRNFDKKIAASLLTIDQLVDRYAQLAALIRSSPVPRIAPDPDDDVVIGTATRGEGRFRRHWGLVAAVGGQISGHMDRRGGSSRRDDRRKIPDLTLAPLGGE